MALKATIFKADLQIAAMDRNHYADHGVTLARHPSETDERMMVRLLAFALFSDDALAFGKGLCVDDEPDLWIRDLTGAVELWIDVGLPDDKWTRKASARARQADVWWQQVGDKLARLDNVRVLRLAPEATQALAAMARRTMRLQCTIQDGHVWITDGEATVQVEPEPLLPRSAA